jgi:putative ABC transport system ATP-binding protein
VINLHDVRKVFNAGKSNEFTAIEGVNLSIDFQRVTALKGPSGSGKTTLLTILGCMARPTSGRITLGDREITSLPERFLTEIRRKTFGFMFQHFNLIKGMSALENVMIPAYPSGEKHSALKKRATDLLALFNLSCKASSKVEWLSGGEAQRVAIARALINKPSIIIADEPTAHLDTRLSMELMEIMRQLKGEGKTILIASHDPIVHDSDVIDRIVTMRDGKVVASGSVP